jgi:hypothetical protein
LRIASINIAYIAEARGRLLLAISWRRYPFTLFSRDAFGKNNLIGIFKMAKAIKAPKRILNCIPSKDRERDWLFEHAAEAGIARKAATIPTSKDLREGWWDIGDQGQTGSCVGWATADSVLRWHFLKAGWIKKKDLIAPRFIWMAAKETDEYNTYPSTFIESDGTSLKAALNIAKNFGSVTDSVLPFSHGELYPGKVEAFYAIAAKLKIASYFSLIGSGGLDLNACRNWLANHGPILTRLDVDATWDNAKNTNGALDVYQPATVRGGHAVALVGYTADRFIVRNSWGKVEWGNSGFGYASNAYSQAAFTEAYGVTL